MVGCDITGCEQRSHFHVDRAALIVVLDGIPSFQSSSSKSSCKRKPWFNWFKVMVFQFLTFLRPGSQKKSSTGIQKVFSVDYKQICQLKNIPVRRLQSSKSIHALRRLDYQIDLKYALLAYQ